MQKEVPVAIFIESSFSATADDLHQPEIRGAERHRQCRPPRTIEELEVLARAEGCAQGLDPQEMFSSMRFHGRAASHHREE